MQLIKRSCSKRWIISAILRATATRWTGCAPTSCARCSPKQPTREQFQPPSESRRTLVEEADRLLNDTPDPGDWTDHLQHFAETASSNSELTEIFALDCVRQARDVAPLSVKQ